jgi:2,3,4,5-tetrahydropyridine-2-carboxylate N-succinyltransferase
LTENIMTQQLQSIIDNAWDNRANISPSAAPKEVVDAVEHVIAELNDGKLRVATREGVGQWTVHQWIKKAVLLSFRLKDNALINGGALNFFDKVPTKFEGMSEAEIAATGVRVVPPAVARRGSFIAKGAILMPSYVNIGAYVDEGTMVDTWATVGSCAKWARTCTCPAAWAWAACWSPCKPTPPSSKTTASSAPAPKSSKA